jgi:hypothetical protein
MQAPGGVERGPLRGTGDFPGILIDEPSGNGRSRLVARPLRGRRLRFLGQHQIAPFGKRSLSYREGDRGFADSPVEEAGFELLI